MTDLDLDKVFRFKIGDVCMHRAIESYSPETRSYRESRAMYVVERILQQCVGGVQLQYQVRAVNANGDSTTAFLTYLEHELVHFVEPVRPPPRDKPAK